MPDFDVFGKVVIKDWAYIGAHAQIMPGVTIGEGAMVAAGSVVTKSVPDGILPKYYVLWRSISNGICSITCIQKV